MSTLPPAFAALEPFVAHWALPTTAARAAARDSAGPDGCAAFLAAGFPRAADALDYLDGKGFTAFDAADTALMNLMLGLAHAALGAELLGPDEARHALDRPAMRIQRSPADCAPA
ncbi:MAG: hypothetical protein KGM17_06710 [Sphingomonadales bacterium]|nr:hypothetical protein [Sphingomonadales bacterium]